MKSYLTRINDSSNLSAAQPPINNVISHESNDLPTSPIHTTTREPINNWEKCKVYLYPFLKYIKCWMNLDFQPIRQPSTTSFLKNLDRSLIYFIFMKF